MSTAERPVLLAVDQQLGNERLWRWLQNSPVLSARSRSGSIRTWSSSAGEPVQAVEALAETALKPIGSYCRMVLTGVSRGGDSGRAGS
jgi:hypothetical protein